MNRTVTILLAVALAAGTLVSFVGPVAETASVPEFAMQVDELGPLLELIASLFEIEVTISN
jgi:hypothetical protein